MDCEAEGFVDADLLAYKRGDELHSTRVFNATYGSHLRQQWLRLLKKRMTLVDVNPQKLGTSTLKKFIGKEFGIAPDPFLLVSA